MYQQSVSSCTSTAMASSGFSGSVTSITGQSTLAKSAVLIFFPSRNLRVCDMNVMLTWQTSIVFFLSSALV